MAIKYADYDGVPEVSERLWHSNWNKDHVQVDSDHTIDSYDNGGDDGGFGEKNGGVLWRGSYKPQKIFGTRIPDSLESLEGDDVGLKFQFKMLERW